MSLTEHGDGDGCKVRVSLSCFAYAKHSNKTSCTNLAY